MSCTAFLVSYLESKWVASDLPIQYAIENDKYPTNNFDPAGTINSIANYNGFSRITLASTVGGFSKGSYVQVSGTTDANYVGVWRVIVAFGPTDFVINAPFSATDTGTLTKHYNNYHTVVRVYTGIRSGHTHASERPMALRGILRIRPSANNQTTVDISSFVRADLAPLDNHFCELDFTNGWANDFNQWTQFYIEFAESYDVAANGVLSTYTSSFVTDEDSGGNTNIYSAAKAANRFQYAQGKSMAEYALNADNYDGNGKFMTFFEKPTYFEGYEWDLSIINDYQNDDITLPNRMYVNEFDSSGNLLGTTTYNMPEEDEGVYRWNAGAHTFDASCDTFQVFVNYDRDTNNYNSRPLTCKYRNPCGPQPPIYLRWLNQVGGWDGWLFIRNKDFILDVIDRTTVSRDIYADWDNVFTTGTTQDDYIYTEAVERRIVRSQVLTEDEAERLGKELRYSNKVQEIYLSDDTDCGNDERRTVLIEPGQFTYLTDGRKFRELEIAFRYTDKIIIPGQ